jgi:hypothetical protein
VPDRCPWAVTFDCDHELDEYAIVCPICGALRTDAGAGAGPGMNDNPILDPRFLAAVKLIERTGSREFQIRYDDDPEPTVWIALGRWSLGPDGRPVAKAGRPTWECAAAMTPLGAVLRLADQILDGGECTHCGKPTGVTHDPIIMAGGEFVCWYQFDPELAVYRRGCIEAQP